MWAKTLLENQDLISKRDLSDAWILFLISTEQNFSNV